MCCFLSYPLKIIKSIIEYFKSYFFNNKVHNNLHNLEERNNLKKKQENENLINGKKGDNSLIEKNEGNKTKRNLKKNKVIEKIDFLIKFPTIGEWSIENITGNDIFLKKTKKFVSLFSFPFSNKNYILSKLINYENDEIPKIIVKKHTNKVLKINFLEKLGFTLEGNMYSDTVINGNIIIDEILENLLLEISNFIFFIYNSKSNIESNLEILKKKLKKKKDFNKKIIVLHYEKEIKNDKKYSKFYEQFKIFYCGEKFQLKIEINNETKNIFYVQEPGNLIVYHFCILNKNSSFGKKLNNFTFKYLNSLLYYNDYNENKTFFEKFTECLKDDTLNKCFENLKKSQISVDIEKKKIFFTNENNEKLIEKKSKKIKLKKNYQFNVMFYQMKKFF